MILFLDFDGVLHPDSVYLENGQPVLRADGALFMHAHLLIEALAQRSDAQIVLSTSWVPRLGFDLVTSFLPPALQSRVIGATWGEHCRPDWLWMHRADQIFTYVRQHKPTEWLALDDDANGWPRSHELHLVHCRDDQRGIADPDTYKQLLWALTT